MSLDYLRTPPAFTQQQTADRAADKATWSSRKSWPCIVESVSGSIVTVSFQVTGPWNLPQVTIPVFGPEWIRYPIQKGDKGYAMAADTTLGNMSGLGSPTPPDTVGGGNLTGLVFMPIGNVNWTPPIDHNKVEVYGPQGVVMHGMGASSITLENDKITFKVGSSSIVIVDGLISINAAAIAINGTLTQTDSSGGTTTINSPLNVNNTITAPSIIGGGHHLESHVHGNGNQGQDTTGPKG